LNKGRLSNTFILIGLLSLTTAVAAQAVPVTLSWTAPVDGAPVDHYKVYWSVEGEAFRLADQVDATTSVIEVEVGMEYHFRVSGVSEFGLEGLVSETSDTVLVAEEEQQDDAPPPAPGLRPNFPNPFNPQTTIRYGIPESHVTGMRSRLEIYSLRGQRVRLLTVSETPGWHEVLWNGKDETGETQPSGHYFVRLTAGGEVATWQMTMIK